MHLGIELIHLGIVTASLFLLVVIPFLPVAYLLFPGQHWPKIVLSAMVLGCSVQASVGLFWSHLVGKWPLYEVGAAALICLLMLIWSAGRARKRVVVSGDLDSEPIQPVLVLILVIGFILRSIHPLDVAYLGQSDAYTHLNYIRNIIDFGYLFNPIYPPGYHWILALPSLVFPIEPYVVARYGGAFFGVGLILGIYVLLDQCVNRISAIFAGFCAAAFPGMVLLMKTGVGVFANQFGLFLLPAIVLFYILSVADRRQNASAQPMLLIALCGMAAAVPMMLIHVFLIIGLERLVMLVRDRYRWFGKTVQVCLLIVPALCLLGYHISAVGAGHRFETAEIMTGYGDGGKKQTVARTVAERIEKKAVADDPEKRKIAALVSGSPYFTLVLDYLSIKRKGFGNVKLDALGWILAGLFLVLFLIGIARLDSSYILIGLWGGLTSVQAGTGLFQFSSYQREGWSLLVATCCLSGIIAASVYFLGRPSILFRAGIIVMMTASAAWSALHPPMHYAIRSSAEDELIRSVRTLAQILSDDETGCRSNENEICSIRELLAENLETVLVTRRYVGWGNQGEIARNVAPHGAKMKVVIFGGWKTKDIFQSDKQYVVLIDQQTRLSGQHMLGAFAMVTPAMVRATLNSRKHLFRANSLILQQMHELPDSRWQVNSVTVSENLTAYSVVPVGAD